MLWELTRSGSSVLRMGLVVSCPSFIFCKWSRLHSFSCFFLGYDVSILALSCFYLGFAVVSVGQPPATQTKP